jgi:hypothetical protein
MKEISADVPSENKKPEKEVGDVVIRKLKTNPEKYLSEKALESYSPKMLAILKNIKASLGSNQFIYSQYRAFEG